MSDFLGDFADLQRMRREQKNTVRIEETRTVTEKRAPTDESVRLLSEMERTAEDRLVARASCHSTPFSFEAWVFQEPGNPFERILRVKFTLGDSPHDIRVPVPTSQVTSKKGLVLEVHRLLMEEMSRAVVVASFAEMTRFTSY